MKTQIISKNQQGLGDSVLTYQEGLNTQTLSFQSPSTLNSSRSEKCDQYTMTDPVTCNCAQDIIPKLKQKAHKSFMQVIQIQNLYKEEIQQVKKFYEETLKTKDKKFKIKQDLLNERCKQLESQIESVKEYYKKLSPYEIQAPLESPFDLDNIENITSTPHPDDSSWSIYNIRQFIQAPNLRDCAKKLEQEIKSFVNQLRRLNSQAPKKDTIDCGSTPDANRTHPQEDITIKIESEITKIFEFIEGMIDNTVQANQKYNELVLQVNQAENRYIKINGLHQAGQKQAKFMSQHIKKISQDKIRVQRRNNELERTVKNQEESIKFLKKMIAQKQVKLSQAGKKDVDCLSSCHLRMSEEDEIDSKSLLSAKMERKYNGPMAKSVQSPPDRVLPRSLNFKKKSADKD